MTKRIVSLGLAMSLTAGLLSGCGETGVKTENLMAGVRPQLVSDFVEEHVPTAVNSFAVRLLQTSQGGEKGVLVSPLSVLAALGMTANGAEGDTLAQMETAFGLSSEELNGWLHSLAFPKEKNCTVYMANSIWLRDAPGLTIQPDFLQTNANYYSAAAFRAAFDNTTLEDINRWVKENTGGMIEKIIEDIPEAAMLYLVNALSFDAEWQTIYQETAVREGIFTTEDGTEQTAEFLYSGEYSYLRDEEAQGFLKPYQGGRFAFMGLLPDEGLSLEEYIKGFTGERLQAALDGASNEEVHVSIPKFEAEYSTELSETLKAMGMKDAFDPNSADFSGIGSYQDEGLYISRVLHKTKLAVDERGTKAGAATAVEMRAGGALIEEPKVVHLDRPFVYGLIDLETNTPLFLGILTDV